MRKKRVLTYQWYAVKLIFESIISGKPDPKTIDENYTNSYKNFEESIVIVKAQSFEQAYSIAEKKASQKELEYTNPYGELVNIKFVQAIHCFSIGEETLGTGVEVYWRPLRVSKDTSTEDFLDRHYPETIEDNSGIDNNFILRNGKFNKISNSED